MVLFFLFGIDMDGEKMYYWVVAEPGKQHTTSIGGNDAKKDF